jgi:putative ABC transport system permease protein
MTRLWQDLPYALRTFAKAPGFTAIAILVLAAGVGANTAVFTLVNELLFRPLSGRAGDLVGLFSHDRTTPDSYRAFSYANYADIREQNDVFDALMAHTFAMVGTPAGDETRRTFAALISSNYFDTLGVRLAAGRPFTLDEERPGSRIPSVIVTYGRWQREQLDPAFIGKTITINTQEFTVVGVAPRGFTGTMALVSADLYLPLGMFDVVMNDRFRRSDLALADRANAALIVAGRLKAGLKEEMTASRLDVLSRQLEAAYPAENKNQLLTTSKLPRVATSTQPQTDTAVSALSALLMGLASVVLVIACLNLANMLLARGAARRKEIAVRLALGARRGRVIRQLLTESVVLAAVGAGLGLVLSYWATRALALSMTAAFPITVTFRTRPDATVLMVTIIFTVLSTVAFGLGPALRLSRRDLVADLKDRGGDGARTGRRFGARNLMVIGQVALSLAMLTAGGIFVRTALAASSRDPGYSYDRLLLGSIDGSLAGFDEPRGRATYMSLLNRLRASAGVRAVCLASTLPFGDIQEGGLYERVGGATEEPAPAHTYRVIGADYFSALGVRMLRGREFSRAEEESSSVPHVAIVDEAFARRMFGASDPIGQMIRAARRPDDPDSKPRDALQIVGIAPPVREELLDREPVSHVYVPFGRHYGAAMHLHVKLSSLDESAGLDLLRREIRAVDSRLPVLALSTMRTFHEKSLELFALTTGARLFTSLGALALLLAVVGLYGVKSYVVAQRTREIGIRMALGATARDVLRLVLRDGLFLTGTGVALGLPLAIIVSLAFTKVFVEIGGFDALVVGSATAMLAAAAAVATLVPARRATKVQPLQALQEE